MIAQFVVVYLCGSCATDQVLGATTIRTESLGNLTSKLPETSGLFPIDRESAMTTALCGVPSSQTLGSGPATTVTPQVAAWADMAGGKPARGPEVTGISGRGSLTGHPSPPDGPRKLYIHEASQKQSEQASAYRISTLMGVTPSRTLLNATGSILRGELSSPSASSDSLVRAFASAISFDVLSLYRSSASSALAASLLWETIDPVVVTPIAIADNAASTTDIISQKSQNSPFWPRNRVEAATFALSIVSVIGAVVAIVCGIVLFR
jgi:hypothetical protein